eukprot:TRINITY_DN15162_c0_g2_i5.p2 TRINITY_DN15162_c0_g2~~TRINITY_DN15162_c0_g2_i5.p2  ORF type:complete len:250 (-),score=81.75 TRINITY_DN15162_c0_g2_i5:234-983(-)
MRAVLCGSGSAFADALRLHLAYGALCSRAIEADLAEVRADVEEALRAAAALRTAAPAAAAAAAATAAAAAAAPAADAGDDHQGIVPLPLPLPLSPCINGLSMALSAPKVTAGSCTMEKAAMAAARAAEAAAWLSTVQLRKEKLVAALAAAKSGVGVATPEYIAQTEEAVAAFEAACAVGPEYVASAAEAADAHLKAAEAEQLLQKHIRLRWWLKWTGVLLGVRVATATAVAAHHALQALKNMWYSNRRR